MKCTQCGAELAPGARYCGECWAVVSSQPSEIATPATDAGVAGGSTPALAGRLVVEIGPDEGKEFPLRGTMRIGRSEDSEITLADAQASRHHAAVSPEPGGFTIQDLNSSNGTFVNGKRLDEPRLLKDGDRLRVVQETPLPQTVEPRKGTSTGRIVLGAGLAVVLLAVAAVAVYFLLGNSDGDKSSGNASEKAPAAITQVVTSAPTQVVTKIVTSEPAPTATSAPISAPSGPDFGPITFARDKTDANEPIDPATTFPARTLRVYALFDYEGMSTDLEWDRT